MKRSLGWWAVAVAAGVLSGCVEQRYVITSDPPGATVLRNGKPIGVTPVDDHFLYYGKYHFTLIKDGFETLQVDQDIPMPWYEYFPLDFISENLVPWPIQDVRRFHYQMQPRCVIGTEQLLHNAQDLRNRGQGLSDPSVPVGPPVPPRP